LLAARGIGIAAATDFLEPMLRVLLPDPPMLSDMGVATSALDRSGLLRYPRRRVGWCHGLPVPFV
jgi:hypothetical protein